MTPEEEAKLRLSIYSTDFDKMVALVIAARTHVMACCGCCDSLPKPLGDAVCAIVGHEWRDSYNGPYCQSCGERPDDEVKA